MLMCPYDKEIEKIKRQLVHKYHPENIILFGSCAKGRVGRKSDIDLCVIMETTNKRETVRDILIDIEYDLDLDVVIYTPAEWNQYKDDKATLAGIINRTGVNLIG